MSQPSTPQKQQGGVPSSRGSISSSSVSRPASSNKFHKPTPDSPGGFVDLTKSRSGSPAVTGMASNPQQRSRNDGPSSSRPPRIAPAARGALGFGGADRHSRAPSTGSAQHPFHLNDTEDESSGVEDVTHQLFHDGHILGGQFRDQGGVVHPNLVTFYFCDNDASNPNNLACYVTNLDPNFKQVNLPASGPRGPLHGMSRNNIFFANVALKARFRRRPKNENPVQHKNRVAAMALAEMNQDFLDRP